VWGATFCFILKPQKLSKPAPKPQPLRRFALRLWRQEPRSGARSKPTWRSSASGPPLRSVENSRQLLPLAVSKGGLRRTASIPTASNTQRTSWLCLYDLGQEIPKFHIQRICLADIKQGRSVEKTASVRGIGSKWPNMGLQHATYAWDVCWRAV
jgi:hypothetical protein